MACLARVSSQEFSIMANQPRRRLRVFSLIIAVLGLGLAITLVVLNPTGINTSHAQTGLTPVVTSLPPTAPPRGTPQP
jgi:hypothetical protein